MVDGTHSPTPYGKTLAHHLDARLRLWLADLDVFEDSGVFLGRVELPV